MICFLYEYELQPKYQMCGGFVESYFPFGHLCSAYLNKNLLLRDELILVCRRNSTHDCVNNKKKIKIKNKNKTKKLVSHLYCTCFPFISTESREERKKPFMQYVPKQKADKDDKQPCDAVEPEIKNLSSINCKQL